MARDGKPTKARIEATALRLFVAQGVTETTTRDIAAGAGVAEGTIYRHFASKEALVRELFSTRYAAMARALDALQQREDTARAKLDQMVRGFCEMFDADRVLFSFLLIVQHQQLRRIPADAASPIEVLRRVIAEAMAAGQIPAADPDLATAMVLGIVLRPAIFAMYGRLEGPLSQHADALSAACWRALNP
jgi:AcrR family transcriptional regulator